MSQELQKRPDVKLSPKTITLGIITTRVIKDEIRAELG